MVQAVHILDMNLCIQMSKKKKSIFSLLICIQMSKKNNAFFSFYDKMMIMILQQLIFFYRGLLNKPCLLLVRWFDCFRNFHFRHNFSRQNDTSKSLGISLNTVLKSRGVNWSTIPFFGVLLTKTCYYCRFQHLIN